MTGSAPPPADDVDRIMAVMQVAFDPEFGEAWNRRQIEDALVLGNCHYLLAGADGEAPAPGAPVDAVAGFALSRTGYDEEELLLFAVCPRHRGQGIGRRLLERFGDSARSRRVKRLLLEMRRGNTAESLYRRYGFQPVGVRPNYYRTLSGTRLDAITFACSVDD